MKINNATALIKLDTQEYPVYLKALRAFHPNISFPEEVDRLLVEQLGYAVVEHTEMPTADVVTEGKPELVDGVWKRTWVTRSFNDSELGDQLTERKRELLEALKGLTAKATEVGMPYVLHDGRTIHIQLRLEDRINLLALKGEADALLAAQSLELLEFRPYENISVELTPAEFSLMTGTALLAMKGLYRTIWSLKDQIVTAMEFGELPVLPESLF